MPHTDDIRYKMVTCDRCDKTKQCTPSSDFYLTALWKDEKKRVCESCFRTLWMNENGTD